MAAPYFLVIFGPPAVGEMTVARSEVNLRDLEARYRMHSDGALVCPGDYVKLETTESSADDAADRIVAALGLRT